MNIEAFFDKDTFTLSYVVFDSLSQHALIVDPVLDYDPATSKITTQSLEKIVAFVGNHKLSVQAILETHAHADHLSSSQWLKTHYPNSQIVIGEQISEVQKIFRDVFNLGKDFPIDGRQFDSLFGAGEIKKFGSLKVNALATPGHTPACLSYVIGDAVFTGDALFMPDYGTGRTDFPGGDAETLYDSITKNLYTLPDSTRVFVGHDYLPQGRDLAFESTIGQQKRQNIRLNAQTTREEFVEFRRKRDTELSAPRLLLPSVQLNINAGHLPKPEDNNTRYFKLPVRQ